MRQTAQSSIEYATIVAVVAAALLGMAIYVKRSIFGHMRSAADSIGEQYHPTQTTSEHTLDIQSTTIMTSKLVPDQVIRGYKADVMEHTTEIPPQTPETTTRRGHEEVSPMGSDVWK